MKEMVELRGKKKKQFELKQKIFFLRELKEVSKYTLCLKV